DGFINRLYLTTLGRTPSNTDRAFWVSQLTTSTHGAVGRAIYQSDESRNARLTTLTQRYLQRDLDPLHARYWRAVLAANDGNDIAAATALASLPDYRTTAQTRF
ncbi:MAG TPA: hypothetical protein VEW93_03085, partial [Acidimicrobiales bacterium]|nr:hypothetical protein [Acidimicrobiales bacterium]